MRLADVKIGMRVHADDCAPEDADQGRVIDINYETGMVEVAWDTLQCSEQLAEGLKPGDLPGGPYRYRVVDARSGRVLAEANTLSGLYPESDREWAKSQERTPKGWRDVPSMRRAPDGRWL